MANPFVEQVAQKTAVVGGGTTAGIAAWFGDNWFLLGGLIVSVLGLAVTFYFQCRRDRRERITLKMRREEHEQKMQEDTE